MKLKSNTIISLAAAWSAVAVGASIYGLSRPDCNVSPAQVAAAISQNAQQLRDATDFYKQYAGHEQMFNVPIDSEEKEVNTDQFLNYFGKKEQEALAHNDIVKLCNIYKDVSRFSYSEWTALEETTNLPAKPQKEITQMDLDGNQPDAVKVNADCRDPTVAGKLLGPIW